MASGTVVSLEEYLSTSYDPDCEYVDGELVERNVGESDHSGLQGVIFAWLFNRRKQLGIHVYPEMRVQVAKTRFRVPDICVTTAKVKGPILRFAPLICIEILSPEDRMDRVQPKIDDYIRFGVPYVWVIDPRKRLECPDFLVTTEPAIHLPLKELLTEMDEEIDPE